MAQMDEREVGAVDTMITIGIGSPGRDMCLGLHRRTKRRDRGGDVMMMTTSPQGTGTKKIVTAMAGIEPKDETTMTMMAFGDHLRLKWMTNQFCTRCTMELSLESRILVYS